MSAKTMMNNKMLNSQKGHFTHDPSSRRESNDRYKRDYDWPTHSQKIIPKNYDRDGNDDK